MIAATAMPQSRPLPPENLLIAVGPFADADLFRRSGEETVADITRLCGLRADHHVLDIGCGCGRLALPLVPMLAPPGRYDGLDVARELLEWCRDCIAPHAPNFRFQWADVRAGEHNPDGTIPAAEFRFPYADNA